MTEDRLSSRIFEGLRFSVMRWVTERMRGPWKATDYRVFTSVSPEGNAWITFVGVVTRVATPFNNRVSDVRVGGVDPWAGLRAVVDLAPQTSHTEVATLYLYEWLCSRDSAWLWGAFSPPEAHAFAVNGLWPEWMPPVDEENLRTAATQARRVVTP